MGTTADITIPLEAGQFYHIFNRGNNRENIFLRESNYHYFLRKYRNYLGDYVDTLAYCLLPNHFHLIIKVQEDDLLLPVVEKEFTRKLDGHNLDDPEERNRWLSWAISEKIRRWLMAYAKAINKQEGRTGSLLQKPFRRKLIDEEGYLIQAICYTHLNSVHHQISDDFRTYPWSSYRETLIETPGLLSSAFIFNLFEGKQGFIDSHFADWDRKKRENEDKFWME